MKNDTVKTVSNALSVGEDGLLSHRVLICCILVVITILFASSTPVPKDPDKLSTSSSSQKRLPNKGTPVGLFVYNQWIDLNENQMAERNEFFGLGKKVFFREEAIRATLYDPLIRKNTNLKIRIWDSTGNLLKAINHKYTAGRLFTISNIEQVFRSGNYIITINPENSTNTYKVSFSLKGDTPAITSVQSSKEVLSEGIHLISQWEDIDQDKEFDTHEITNLTTNTFTPGNVNFALALKLSTPNQRVVFQTWDTLGNLLGMTLSSSDSPLYYKLDGDTTLAPNFLKPLARASVGTYKIMAILDNNEATQYEKKVHIQGPLRKDKTYPTTVNIQQKLSPTLNSSSHEKSLEGFFLFADYIDFNRDSIQQEYEFIKLRHKQFNSKIENVHAQFHMPRFEDQDIILRIMDEYGNIIIEQTTHYQNQPQIFELSNTEFRLVPGQYIILLQPGESEEAFETLMTIR